LLALLEEIQKEQVLALMKVLVLSVGKLDFLVKLLVAVQESMKVIQKVIRLVLQLD